MTKINRLRLAGPHGTLLLAIVAASALLRIGCSPSQQDKATQASQKSLTAQRLFIDRDFARALSTTREAMELNSDMQDDSSLADNYFLLANCQRQLGQYDSALSSFQEAVQYFHEVADQHAERKARIALAEFYALMGDDKDAAGIASDAAMAAQVFSKSDETFRALTIAAGAFHRLGRYDQELQTLDALVRLDSSQFNRRSRLALERQRSDALFASGRVEEARRVAGASMVLAASGNDRDGFAEAAFRWGSHLYALGRPDSALRLYGAALDRLDSRSDQTLRLRLLSALGVIAYRAQQFENAHTYFTDAIGAARTAGRTDAEQMLQLGLVACDDRGHSTKAPAYLTDLAARCTDIAARCRAEGNLPGEALAELKLGEIHRERNDAAASLDAYRKSADLSERSVDDRTGDEPDLLTTLMEGDRSGWYDGLIAGAISSGNADSLYALLDRKNSRDIAGFLSRISFQTADLSLNRKLASWQWSLNTVRLLQKDIAEEASNGGKDDSRLRLLGTLRDRQLAACFSAARDLGNPNFAHILSRERPPLRAMRDTLPKGSALVLYALQPGAVTALIATRDTAVIRSAAASRQNLLGTIREYNDAISEVRVNANGVRSNDPSSASTVNQLSSLLSRMLVAPMQQDLRGLEKIYAVLPAEFGWLPLHTLHAEGGPILEHVNVSYLPAPEALLFGQKPERFVQRITGLGYPGRTSWDVEYELKDIRGFYSQTTLLFDTLTTLRHLVDSTYDLLHVAAEFHLDLSAPDNTGTTLADGLTPFGMRNVGLGEMLSVPMPQVLLYSNISQRPGALYRYAPLLFLANGTHTVVTAMWQGDRRARKHFGEGFYTALLSGTPSAEAYRLALLGMMRRDEHDFPGGWGMYYLFGR